jgi:T5SS/PEP-CTERM-associated repeat protein
LGVVILTLALLAVCLPGALDAQTSNWFFDNFSSFTQNTDLVGQVGWVLGPFDSLSPQVTNNAAYIPQLGVQPSPETGAGKDFPQAIASGGITNYTAYVYAAMVMTVTSAPPASSLTSEGYIFSIYQNNGGTGFNTDRLTARDTNGTAFVFGVRVTGAGGSPFSYGTQPLNYNTPYRVIVQRDTINSSNSWVYVNPTSPTLDTNTAYAVANLGTGPKDPGAGSVVIGTQYSPAQTTDPNPGVAISKIAVSTNYADVYNFLTPTNSWTDGNGKWETGSNWSLSMAPSTFDLADLITNAGNNTVTIDATTTNTPSTMTIGNLTISAPPGSTNTLVLDHAGTTPFSVLSTLVLGSNGAVVVNNSFVVAGSVTNAGLIQANSGTLVFLGPNTGTNDTLTGAVTVTNGGAIVFAGTDFWTLATAVAYGGGASGGSIISSNSSLIRTVFLNHPVFRNNNGTLMVVGGNDLNYGQIGGDLTNTYVITGNGSLTGAFGGNNNAFMNQGTIASLAGSRLVLDPRNAFNLGGVQNATNGTIVVANSGTLVIRRTNNAWNNPAARFPTNSGTILMQGGTLRGENTNTVNGANGVASRYVNGSSGLIHGCGTFENFATVQNNGTILADCGGALNFGGTVTNNGTMTAVNGTFINFIGPLVNNGTIIATNGGLQFFSTIINNGTVLSPTNIWIDGNGKWETSGNWLLGHAPSLVESADLITTPGNNTVTLDAATAGSFPSTMTISNLLLSAPVGSSNTLSLSAAGTNTPLRVLNRLTLDGRGVLTVSNSALRADGDLSIGLSGSSNQLTITTGSHLDSVNSVIGSNATANANTVIVTGTNSVWTTTNLVIGVAGSDNLLSISNAARVSISGTFTVGSGPSISGNRIETVDGGMLDVLQTVSVGGTNGGQATFQVTGGSTTLSSNLIAGSSANSTGIVTVTDGGLLVVTNGVLGVGNSGTLTNGSGTGFLTVSNGTLIAFDILLGSSIGGEGLLTVLPGGVVTAPAGCTTCRITANGIILAGGAIIMPDATLYAGQTHPGSALLLAGLAVFSNAVIGVDNTGTLEVDDGSMTLSSNLVVGMSSGATGVVMIAGGTTTVTNGVFGVGNDGTIGGTGGVGRVTVTNGLFEAASILVGDSTGGDSGLTVAGSGYVRVHGGLRANGIKTTLINGGTLEVVAGPPPPFEDAVLHNRVVVGYLGDGRLVVSNGTVKAPEMLVGASAGKTGTVEVAGGIVNLSSNLLVGMSASATGIVTITGGSLIVTNGVFGVGNNGTVGGVGGFGRVAVSNTGIVEAASILVGDSTGGDSGLTVAGSGTVRAHGGLRANGIKTTLVDGGTLEVVEGPPPPFEDPILHDRIVVSYLGDGKLVVSNGTVRTPGMLVGASAGNAGTVQLAGGNTHVFSNMTVGFVACTSTGIVNVVGGNLYVTNATGNAVLEVSSGTFTLSSGTVMVDNLVITNACGHFVRNGGSLIVGTLVLDPNLDADGDGIPNGYEQSHGLDPLNGINATLDSDGDGLTDLQEYLAGTDPNDSASAFRVTSVVPTNSSIRVTWTMGASKTNALQAVTATGFTTNMADIFIVTNTVGTVTNYLDVGGATNIPSRFYRVRLVP